MLTFEHSSGSESFGSLNPAEWFASVGSLPLAVSSSPPSCRSLVEAALNDCFPRHEFPALVIQPEASSAVVVPTGAGAAPPKPVPGPEFAIVVAGVVAVIIWPRKLKRLLRGIVDVPKLF